MTRRPHVGVERAARLFRSRRRCWISALELARVAGLLSSRTRISECRTLLGMRIENRVRVERGKVRSEYRYVGKQAA